MNYNIQNTARRNVSNKYFVGTDSLNLCFMHLLKKIGRK